MDIGVIISVLEGARAGVAYLASASVKLATTYSSPLTEPGLWLIWMINTAPLVSAAAALVVAWLLWRIVARCRRRNKRGFGSGENSFWNRRIRTERPVFAKKHYQLEKTWFVAMVNCATRSGPAQRCATLRLDDDYAAA